MSTESVLLEHPDIGTLKGLRKRLPVGVDQFLGIQYATLADRFSRGALVEAYPSSIDATDCGPIPVADHQGCDIEHALLQHELPHPEYSFSDTECLRLHVSIPSTPGEAKSSAGLPVVAFVHGGGLVTGSASWPQWDLAALVELSVKAGTPVVAVGINYRLGPFGFLTSKTMRQAGYLPNNGLDDQKLGLRWVQKYISGFGGDPNRVTFLGSSIGAASGFTHLQSKEPLFHQLVALGGSGAIPPAPPDVGEMVFGLVIKALDLDSLPPAEQVAAILRMPADEFNSKVTESHAPLSAVLDDDVIRQMPNFTALSKTETTKRLFPGLNWCKLIFMGDAQLDGMIMAITALTGRTDDLWKTLEECVSVALGEAPPSPTETVSPVVSHLLSEYRKAREITSVSDDQNETMMPVIRFMGDILFSQGVRACAQAWASAHSSDGTTAFLTHFNVPNPWPGSWQGHATHALDMAYALQNYNEFMPAGQRACAERMGRDVVEFVNGKQPFAPLHQDGTARVYSAGIGEESVDETKCVSADQCPEVGRFRAMEPLVLDKMMNALLMFLQGPQ